MNSEFNPELIFNMNELAVYIDMLSSKTISFKGEKNIEAIVTGKGSHHFPFPKFLLYSKTCYFKRTKGC